ncbi:Aste57867_8401 [Aphanomyces stellatus]|uniref:NADH-cytochrome b5 reductase n=1 Tax=Aphanomyces stellatus TaxID=120398 RepID=A0A485KKA5_9STRA|nr:hypothetical protein As57867_008369 [Aphanomyces stellatus]VFT85287.1 Aste57867_8401 [Aphanomyces stellatus]
MMLLRFTQRQMRKSKAMMALALEPQAASSRASSPATVGAFLAATILAANFSTSSNENALNPGEWRSFRVYSNEKLTHDTHKLRLEFPSEDQTSGLAVASFLLTKAHINGKPVIRPYTPTSANSQKGHLELIVKGYPTGTMSKHLVELQVGDHVDIKGPNVKFTYKPNSRKHIAMVAGGSGITPMLQVALEVLRNPEDNTDVTLIFQNRTEDDIILRDELASYEQIYPGLKVINVLSKPSESWTGYTGHVNKEFLEKHLPGPSPDHLVLVCGPPSMMHDISGGKAKDFSQGQVEGALKELNYTSEMVFKF